MIELPKDASEELYTYWIATYLELYFRWIKTRMENAKTVEEVKAIYKETTREDSPIRILEKAVAESYKKEKIK